MLDPEGFQPLPTNKLQPLMEAVTTKGPVVVSIDAGGWNAYGGGIYVLVPGASEWKSSPRMPATKTPW